MEKSTEQSISNDCEMQELATDATTIRTAGLPIMSGWRLYVVIFSLALGLFLSALDTSIIATALVTIASDLGQFEKSSWVVVAYMLTYTGFLIVFARLSDIFGRKQGILVALTLFTLWSLACGFATTIDQLIIFRALQGIGGSGIYSLSMAALVEVTPIEKIGLGSGTMGIVSACSSILGPVLGGLITSNTTWRWIFWLNVPVGIAVIVLHTVFLPLNIDQEIHSRALYSRVDLPGVVLSLAGSVVLVFALESGGSQYAWSSAAIITSFIFAGLCWIVFALWEVRLTAQAGEMLPIFPTRLATHRVVGASMITSFFAGFPFTVAIISLPQRFQIVNGLSPVEAGVRILPLLLMTAFGAGSTGIICNVKNISSQLLIVSNLIQLIGVSLLAILPTGLDIQPWEYGVQIFLGWAFGTGLVCLLIISRLEVAPQDLAVTIGATTQVRVFGGLLGLSIIQAVLFSKLRSMLVELLAPEQITAILTSPASLTTFAPEKVEAVRHAYGQVTDLQMRIVVGFVAASLVASCFTWRRHPRRLHEVK